jgi:hypothetical protein
VIAGVLFALKLFVRIGDMLLDDREALGVQIAHDMIADVRGVHNSEVAGAVTVLIVEITRTIQHQ